MSGKKKTQPVPEMPPVPDLDQEIIDEPTTHVTKTRFDMEQEILECWNVTRDIEQWKQSGSDMSTLVAYYETKFDQLWNTFEVLIRQGTIR